MDAIKRKVEGQIQFWSLLGPFFILLSIAALLFKASAHWYFPISALIGIPLCVKWKMKGMAAAIGFLFLIGGIHYQNIELDDRYWHVGLSLSMAFSFIVLTLSLEEVQGVLSQIQVESKSRLENFLLLDEKWKMADLEWEKEREKVQAEIASKTEEITKLQEDKQTFYKLAQLAKDELVQVRNQHDLLLQDLLYKKQQITQLQERVEETELTIQSFVNQDTERQLALLSEQIALLEEEKEIYQSTIVSLEEEKNSHAQKLKELSEKLVFMQEQEVIFLEKQKILESEKDTCQAKMLFLEGEKNSYAQKLKELSEKLVFMQEQEVISLEKQKILKSEKEASEEKLASLEEESLILDLKREELERELNLSKEKETAYLKEQKCFKEEKEQLLKENEKLKQLYAEEQQIAHQATCKIAELEKIGSDLLQSQKEKEALIQELQELEKRNQTSEEEFLALSARLRVAEQSSSLPSEKERRVEAMYLQLREQFYEKSSVLDATRKELFHVNEKLLCYQKKEEESLLNLPLSERYLHNHFTLLAKEYEELLLEYKEEVDALTDLIAHLLQKEASLP